jgi:peroxiredoxin
MRLRPQPGNRIGVRPYLTGLFGPRASEPICHHSQERRQQYYRPFLLFVEFVATCLLACMVAPRLAAQDKADGPANEKAQKTYKEAVDLLRQHNEVSAMNEFKKADKQDGGHCVACQRQLIRFGTKYGEWKIAEVAAEEMVAEAQDKRATAIAHYQVATVFMTEGIQRRKPEYFERAHDEFVKALATVSNFPDAYFIDGRALAQLKHDDEARARFEQFVKMASEKDPNRPRALRYIASPQLARANMAPAFEITTLDGKQLSMDELQGKVVLLDFWATWCQPCREALPHIREVAKKFQGEPLEILSVSVDTDEKKWKEFVADNGMTWAQYFDGGFTGPVARMFSVNAIPHTFTIDADGVLQDEHIGDASIEGKLKKLCARAKDLQAKEGGQSTEGRLGN